MDKNKEGNERLLWKKYNVTIAGTGYVELSLAILLVQHNRLLAYDIMNSKVELINNRQSPIKDEFIEKYLKEKELDLIATTDGSKAFKHADFIIIATPTNYDSKLNFLTALLLNLL